MSQMVFLSFDADTISNIVEKAVNRNDATKIAILAQNLQRGDRLLRSWLEDHGGSILLFHGDEIYATVPGEHLSDLGKIHETLQEAWGDGITIGVGLDLREAKRAMDAGKKKGGSRILFYAPEVEGLLSEDEEQSESHAAKEEDDSPEKLKELELSKANSPSLGPPTPNAAPEQPAFSPAGGGGMASPPSPPSPLPQAQPSGGSSEMPPPPSSTNMAGGMSPVEAQFHQIASQNEAEGARAEAQTDAADPGDQHEDVKQVVTKILQAVKKQAAIIDQLKDQAPEIYQVLMALIQVSVVMAKRLAGPAGTEAAEKEAQQGSKDEGQEMSKSEPLAKGERELRRVRATALNDDATPEQLQEAVNLIAQNPTQFGNSDIKNLLAHPKFTTDMAHQLAAVNDPEGNVGDYVITHAKQLDLDRLIRESFPKGVVENKTDKLSGDEIGDFGRYRTIVQGLKNFKNVTPEQLHQLYTMPLVGDKPYHWSHARSMIPTHENIGPQTLMEIWKKDGKNSWGSEILSHHKFPKEEFDRVWRLHYNKFKKAIVNPTSPRSYSDRAKSGPLLQTMVHSPHLSLDALRTAKAELQKAAEKGEFPGNPAPFINDALERRDTSAHPIHKNGGTFVVKPGLNKHRIVRDLIESKGGQLKPNELGKLGSVLQGVPREANGDFSSKKIQEHIDATPGITLHYGNHVWGGGQRHSTDNSNVFRIGFPTEMAEKLRAAGVDLTKGYTSSHPGFPVGPLGWVRWTGDDKGVHIDEIQHDFDWPEAKKIEAMFGHPIHRVLHDAFHEGVRQGLVKPTKPLLGAEPKKKPKLPGIGTPVSIWTPESKAPLSGLNPATPLPGHFQHSYRIGPEKMGYQPSTYGTLPTHKTKDLKGKATWQEQVRKFEKAYEIVASLQPKSTGIDNQVKVQDHIYPTNKSEIKPFKGPLAIKKAALGELNPAQPPPTGNKLSKPEDKEHVNAVRDREEKELAEIPVVTNKPPRIPGRQYVPSIAEEGKVTKAALPMPEANKAPPKPNGAMVERVEGQASPQVFKEFHQDPGQAAHVGLDGKPEGKTTYRRWQSGKVKPDNKAEHVTGLGHPVSALNPVDR